MKISQLRKLHHTITNEFIYDLCKYESRVPHCEMGNFFDIIIDYSLNTKQ